MSEKVFEAFKVFDPDGNGGHVKTDQLRDLLEYCEFKMDDQEMYKIVSDLDPSQNGFIEVAAFKNYMVHKEIERLLGNDETELLDAYVAMGGEADGGGCVDANKLIQTIKDEFQMTIDIEKLIEEIDEDGSGEIEFDEFKALLTSEGAA